MDRMIYTAMTGAKQALERQSTVAHNLANLESSGFRAEVGIFRAVPITGAGAPTRVLVVDSTPGSDFTPGAVRNTGRDLDIAVQGRGWIAVQASNGGEAYTRAGSMQMSPNGLLQTASGYTVLGDAGPISIPPDTVLTIAGDGTVSTVQTGNRPTSSSVVGRIKLVNPPDASLERGADGLFRVAGAQPAPADPNVRLISGALEGSNVHAVDAMINIISLARQFDMQMKVLQNAESNSRDAAQLLTLGA